jgi:predicted RNase H-like nuclease
VTPASDEVLVAGVDGCPGGWAVVTGRRHRGGTVSVRFESTVAAVIEDLQRDRVAVVAIDMPIGLPAVGARPCDLQAREALGPRRHSVFPAPLRAVLGAGDHAEACRRSRAIDGRGLSIQAFNLLPKIAEIDHLLPADLHHRLVEAHPELAFLRLNHGRPLPAKRLAEGREARRALLRSVVGPELDLRAAARAAGVPETDALDAAALLATARRLAAGEAQLLGGETDPTGRPMQVAW